MKAIRKNNHYVSKFYLKAWSVSGNRKKVYVYQTLVPNDKVPVWKEKSIKSIACQEHLYTSLIDKVESDEIECWMAQEIEEPAASALCKIRNRVELNASEKSALLRYVALQDVRTPLRFIQNVTRMKKEVPSLLEGVLKEAVTMVKAKKRLAPSAEDKNTHSMPPIKLSKRVDPDTRTSYLQVRTVIGRGMWLASLQHLLSTTYQIMEQHSWSVIEAPKNEEWFTSDNPVIKLNYYANGTYDLNGGWGNRGTEIIMPLSPNLLLYTKVGDKIPLKNCSPFINKAFQSFIAQNAYRQIYASKPLAALKLLRPRCVDKEIYNEVHDRWRKWPIHQKAAEDDLFNG